MKWMFWKKDDGNDDRWEKNLPDTITRSVAKNTVPKIVPNASHRTDSFAISESIMVDSKQSRDAIPSLRPSDSFSERTVPATTVANSIDADHSGIASVPEAITSPELINAYVEMVNEANRSASLLRPPPPVPPKPRYVKQ